MISAPLRTRSIALVALLAGSILVSVAGAAQASNMPQTVPMTADFGELAVGESASQAWDVTVAKPATLTPVIRRVAVDTGRWSVHLCPTSGERCIDVLAASAGTPVPQGTYRLAIGVTILAVGPVSTSIEGHLSFVERSSGSLAMTGSDSLVPLLLTSAVTAAVGLFMILASRRRREAREPKDA